MPKIKGHDKDDLLAVVQYITALDPSEPLDTRNRTLVSHWYFVYARIFFYVDCVLSVSDLKKLLNEKQGNIVMSQKSVLLLLVTCFCF